MKTIGYTGDNGRMSPECHQQTEYPSGIGFGL